MTRQLKLAALVVAIGLVAALLGFSVARFLRVASIETPVATTDFALRDLAGKTHSLADWRGKVVLLNFWATWCPPCRREIPLFIELQERYGKQGLQIIGIAVDNPEAVARYWQEMHINYPLLLADETTYELMAAYGNRQGGLPYSVLITADGRIAGVKIGAYAREELELALKSQLTATKSSSP
jgi:thiol-disulfide isomerase/thioredoxin